MKLTYNGIEVDFFPKGIPNRILLSLSGGLDSTSLLYLLTKYFPQIEIYIYTGIDAGAPFDIICARDSIEWVKSKFPNHNIKEHYALPFDASDPEYLKQAEELPDDDPAKSMHPFGTSKNLQTRNHVQMCKDKCKPDHFVTATTANPPDQVMKDRGFYNIAEPVRNEPHNRDAYRGDLYAPYINANKRFVAGVYKENGLMDDLFHFTGSCVGDAIKTDNYNKECGTCFWCKEKEWAFED